MAEKLLSDLYNDPSSGVSLGSATSIYKKAVKIDPNIRKADVLAFLKKKTSYRLFAKKKSKFPRRKMYSHDVSKNWAADLLEFSESWKKTNRPYSFLYCSIDIFSSHLFIFPLKDKGSKEILLAIDKSFRDLNCPETILTDLEPAFYSKSVLDFLKTKHVTFLTQSASVNLPIKNGMIERAIRFLKTIIARFCEEYSVSRFVDFLPQIVEIFNQHKNRRTKYSPNQLRFDLDAVADYQQRVENELKQSVQKIDESQVLPIGTYVSIQELPKNVFAKEIDKRFSREAYLIASVRRTFPITYGLFPPPPGRNRKYYKDELFILSRDHGEKHSLPAPIEKVVSKRDLRGGRDVYECILIGSQKHVYLSAEEIKNRFILFRNQLSEEILG